MLGTEERAMVDTVREFVDRDVRPVVRELEHSDTYPDERAPWSPRWCTDSVARRQDRQPVPDLPEIARRPCS